LASLTVPSANPSIVFVSQEGHDRNSGLTWGAAKATVQAALHELPPAGGLIQVGAGHISLDVDQPARSPAGRSYVAPPAGVTIAGLGEKVTTLGVSTDSGQGVYAIDASASSADAPITIANLSLVGPGFHELQIGQPPAAVSGLATGSKLHVHDVVIEGFYAGIEIMSDHEILSRCKSSSNYYNAYVSATHGNQTLIACDFTGAARASVAAGPSGSFDSGTWLAVHVGFAPVGLLKEPALTEPALLSNSWCQIAFEQCANACIYDATPGGSTTTLMAVAFFSPVFAIGGSLSTYYDATLPATAAVDVGYIDRVDVSCDLSYRSAAATIYSCRRSGWLRTDKVPAAGDFSSTMALSRYDNEFTGALVLAAVQPVSAGSVLQFMGLSSVAPFAGTSPDSYIGTAITSAAADEAVAVATTGLVYLSCSGEVPAGGVGLEIDPDSPTQVRAATSGVTGALGLGMSAPSALPVIAVSNEASDAATETVQARLLARHQPVGYVAPGIVAALPPAGPALRGQILTLSPGAGVATDGVYVCVMSEVAGYEWRQIGLM
jgi:hypothetical protein